MNDEDISALQRSRQAVGGAFEVWIEIQHEKAKLLGILAHVVHNQAQTKMIKGKLEYTQRGVSDYSGVLEGGLHLSEEAKSSKSSTLPKAKISPLQQRHLDVVAHAGGLALLLVEFRQPAPPHKRFAIPWLEVPWATKKSAESVSIEDLASWAVVPDCYLLRWHPGGKSSVPRRIYSRE